MVAKKDATKAYQFLTYRIYTGMLKMSMMIFKALCILSCVAIFKIFTKVSSNDKP